MLKFSRLICALCVLVGAAVSYGAAIKVKAFDWVHVENPEGDGMAIANYNPGADQTEITGAITDFLPGTDYFVEVGGAGGIAMPVTTNPSGNATAHGFTNGNICNELFETEICLIVWRDIDGNLLRAVDEERAAGCTPCP